MKENHKRTATLKLKTMSKALEGEPLEERLNETEIPLYVSI